MFKCKNKALALGQRIYVMGILNVTPDSFSDGGRFLDAQNALGGIEQMLAAGADIIDIGGQSTRPGHTSLSAEEELARLTPLLEHLGAFPHTVFSVDTFYPAVAEAALQAGAHIVNDVSGRINPEMARLVAEQGAGWVIMHAEHIEQAANAPQAVATFFAKAAQQAVALGVDPTQLCFDPGIGFGKTTEQNLQLIAQTAQIKPQGSAYLLGASRKRCLGALVGDIPPEGRDPATHAAHTLGILGGADIVRVHDVAGAVQAARVADAIRNIK